MYTNYRFTSVSKVKIKVVNKKKSAELVVKIIEVGTGLLGTDKMFQTVKVSADGTSTWSKSISKKYYILFKAPSNFSGYIKNA